MIFLNEQMRAMMERLKGNGSTHVFLNTEGKPWTKSALQQQVWRIKTKLELADDLCAYLCRHGFGTRAVLSGVDAPTVAELMGHNSLEMVSRVYVHLADQHQHRTRSAKHVVRDEARVARCPHGISGSESRSCSLGLMRRVRGGAVAGAAEQPPSG